jgi:hypothetical protein
MSIVRLLSHIWPGRTRAGALFPGIDRSVDDLAADHFRSEIEGSFRVRL